MNSFSAVNFVEAVEMWDFFYAPMLAFQAYKNPDLLEMVHILEEKKSELARLTANGASILEAARETWELIDSQIIFPKFNLQMLEESLSKACGVFPALLVVREMARNNLDLDSALVIAALASVNCEL